MQLTVDIDDALLEEARRLTGIVDDAALVSEGLRALIAREETRKVGGTGFPLSRE